MQNLDLLKELGRVRRPVLRKRGRSATIEESLTQAGATHRVVLHLVERGGALVATLDSPDQGAKDIPVPAVRVSGRSLHFGLGAFRVSYQGVRRSIGR